MKIKSKNDKKREKKAGKKETRPKGGTSRDGPKKLIFYRRTVKRNRNEIEAQEKNQILSTQQRQRK